MSGHTPGPWSYDSHDGRVDGGGGTVVQPGSVSDPTIGWIPDGDLIEAAPDLLEAAKSVLEGYGKLFVEAETSARTALDRAIAKAEGASR